ncbi:MAG: hypothetical protein B1H40_02835 [Candidatus Latescibacteria bacterium 4484_181]|nr:MAG: hypothetical protein B1H40_02835 [Candidatus Latescibacteria bacterium 4484_181]
MRRGSQGKYKTFSLILYPEGSKRVYVEGRYLPEIAKQLQGKSALLTVGAGRINVMVGRAGSTSWSVFIFMNN